VGWTLSTASVLEVGQSVQKLCCVLFCHYSDVAVVWTISTATVLWIGRLIQKLNSTVNTETAFCVGQSVQ